MTQGRCPGCGLVDASCKKITSHVLHCPDYIALYKSDPDKCLDPESEYLRWRTEDQSVEARAAAKEERLAARFAENDSRRLEQADRWKPRNLLDD